MDIFDLTQSDSDDEILFHPRPVLERPPQEEKKQAPFRFRGVRVFLTYPQCDLDGETLRTHILRSLESLDPPNGIQGYLACKEEHKDGSPHCHALVHFERRLDTSDVRFFDAGGFHPNIKPARAYKNIISYIKKDGNWIADGTLSATPSVIQLAEEGRVNEAIQQFRS